MDARLPVFPLGTVLFPGLVLPLHIFEARYLDLMRHLRGLPEGTPREFGVVAIRSGGSASVSAGPEPESRTGPESRPGQPELTDRRPDGSPVTLHDVGCTAELRQVTELPDGRLDIVTVGRRRFRIARVEAGSTPYLTAEVEWLPEPVGQEQLADLLAPRVLAVFRRYLTLVRDDPEELSEQLPDDPTVLSHLVAATAALTLTDRQRLLATPDTAGRLSAELRLLNREAALLRQVRAVPVPLAELAVPASPN
ncbi:MULTISPECIES: LON peptidase substrate-binding domain-containing protein [unclassified Plantactinospora]|uniref:LON peptidase substrate-binding domain-containing protein n=1 Tax=unclassified Plantactinospora TaxID=2631981 RepID=UPI000D171EDE|nr:MULTISPECIES: LON peptidase substrate-binding domain-containing protein [unclassified Plantactinospora]AVT32695.1 peptidase S16 [Plantactinospora sp. BC1]AVT39335.1 peptidase S16 [Plantactinospora sp. BB1]